jgi:hypothetical protein
MCSGLCDLLHPTARAFEYQSCTKLPNRRSTSLITVFKWDDVIVVIIAKGTVRSPGVTTTTAAVCTRPRCGVQYTVMCL